jgi:hypothetical protein
MPKLKKVGESKGMIGSLQGPGPGPDEGKLG